MNLTRIVHRAFETTRRYRALWVVGFLWALTGGGGGGANFGGNFGGKFGGDSGNFEGPWSPPSTGPGEDWFNGGALPGWWPDTGQILLFLAVLIPLLLLLAVILTVARYVLRAGVYRGLDRIESDGWIPTVRGIWRLGWQSRTWRLWLQDLVWGIPFAMLAVATLLFALAPLLLLIPDEVWLNVVGIVASIGLVLLWLAVLFVVGAVAGVLSALWGRAAVVDDQGVFEAMLSAVRLARANPWDLTRTWLLMLGIGLVMMFVTVATFAVLVVAALAVAGGPAYVLYQQTGRLLFPLLYGVPVALAILILPSAAVRGLFEILAADVWTLVYRELPARPGLPAVRSA